MPERQDRDDTPSPPVPPSVFDELTAEGPFSPSQPSLKTVLTSEGYRIQDEKFDEAADLALRNRPYFSFRARLLVALSAVFVMAAVLILWSVRTMSELSAKIEFLEVADQYAAEIQQARRYEKNFLLYGKGVEEALEHTHQAQQLVADNTERFEKVVGREAAATMTKHIADYEQLLRELRDNKQSRRQSIEVKLRDHGAEMVSSAMELTEKERRIVRNRLALARLIPFVWLGALLLVLVLVANFVARGVLNVLHRFVSVADRIGSGDFTPITPGRRFRDEFTDLALHINSMVRRLDRQHRILVESHKLRAMGTLVAGVAHELNNPLNNIMLTVAVIEEDYQRLTDEERLEMIGELIGETERARKIVHNLLDFARESDTQIEALQLPGVVDETLALMGNQIKLKKIKVEHVEAEEHLPPVHGDRQLLRQVFMNLILNAIDALPEGGKIRIEASASQREGFVGVDFTDNGPGIPEHVLSRIFDPFFTTKPQGKGTGLGLSVSRGIIRKLGGYLQVSTKLGSGTTFTVLLPVTGLTADALRGAG